MKLRPLFILFLIIQLPAYALAIYVGYHRSIWLMYGAEVMLLLDIILSLWMYRRIMLPLRNLEGALNLLRGRDWNVAMRKVGMPEVDAIVEVFNDMMRTLHAQRVRLEEAQHFLTYLAELAPVGIIIYGQSGRTVLCNPAATRMLESSAALGPAIHAMTDGQDITLRSDQSNIFRCSRRHFLENGVRRDFFIIENVTDTVAAAEREAYGKLIRLIAHEVNNTVTGLTTAMATVDTGDELNRQLLDACGERAMGLSRFISRFAEVVKTPDPVLETVDLAALVTNMRPFLESLCTPRNITLITFIPPGTVNIRADAPQIEQVLVNIVKNSAESIGSGGNISITLTAAPVTITVTDDGPGIPGEKADKIFSPFFTDKPTGQGIGLTFVADVLRRHRAAFSLTTGPADPLTRFHIRF